MADSHFSASKSFRGKVSEMRKQYVESGEMSSEEFAEWLHEIFGVASLTELTMTEEAALGIIQEELAHWFGGENQESPESNQKADNFDENEIVLPTTPEIENTPASEQRGVTATQSSAVVVRQNSAPVSYDPSKLDYIQRFASAVAASGMFVGVTTADQATVIMLKGLSIGIEPFDALAGFDLIPGRDGKSFSLTPRVKLLRALVERTGLCVRFDVTADDRKATAVVQRKGRNVQTFTFTWEDAERMGLTKKYNYQTMPKRMLAARVAGLAINSEFSEVNYGFGNNILDAVDGDPEP